MKKRLAKCMAVVTAVSLAVGGWGLSGGSMTITEAAAAEDVTDNGITDGSDSATPEDEITEAVIMDETDTQTQEDISTSGDITETADQTASDSRTDQDILAEIPGGTEAGTDADDEDTSVVSDRSDSCEESAENSTEVQKSTAETGSEESVQLQSAPADEDINRPVIESVELLQNGQTLHEGDTVEVRVHAYDADSGIREIRIRMYEMDSEGDYQDIYAQYDEALGCYVATLELEHVGNGQIRISYIHVVDMNSNYTDAPVDDENGKPLYTFSLENSFKSVKAIDVSMSPMGGVVEYPDIPDLSFALEENLGIRSGKAEFTHDDRYASQTFNLRMDDETGRFVINGYSISIVEGSYTLDSVTLGRFGNDLVVEFDNMSQYSYTFNYASSSEPIEDTESPVISSIYLEQNGNEVQSGDVLDIVVEAEDNVEMAQSATLRFQAAADNIEDDYQYVYLEYDPDAGAYTGTWEIPEGTYPCEWYLDYISVEDTSGNIAYNYYELLSGYPYYVLVYAGEVFSNPSYDVSVTFYELNENGEWEDCSEITTQLPRRSTLEEAGITLPEGTSRYSGFKFTGWGDYSGKPYNPDYEVINNSNISIYAMYDHIFVDMSLTYINTYGDLDYYSQDTIVMPAGSTYGDLESMLNSMEVPESYDGLELSGWEYYEDPEECLDWYYGHSSVDLTAVYDSIPYSVVYNYADENGLKQTENVIYFMERGATYGDLFAMALEYLPEDTGTDYGALSWETESSANYDMEEEIPDSIYNGMYLNAVYEGKTVVYVDLDYYDENGLGMEDNDFSAVFFEEDEGLTIQDLMDEINSWEVPEMYEGLQFIGWGTGYDSSTLLDNGNSYSIWANYENCMVRYFIDPQFESGDIEEWDDHTWGDVFCQVVEEGDTITIPDSFDGYSNVIFPEDLNDFQAGDTVTVDGDMDFWGYAQEDPEQPDTPDTPDIPDTPDAPDEPDTPVTPEDPGESTPGGQDSSSDIPAAPELPETTVSDTIQMIENASDGSSVNVNMDGATVIPAEVLEAAQGKDVDLVLDMGEYTWTINGKDIMASTLQDIDLGVTINSNTIPNSTVQTLANGKPVMQISLAHEGDFGFRASLTFNVGSGYSDKYANLYYYDSDKRMVYMESDQVDASGNVTFSFSHASDYVVVISDEPMSQADVPAGLQPVTGGGQATGTSSPETGDTSPIIPIVSAFAVAACVLAVSMAYRKRRG